MTCIAAVVTPAMIYMGADSASVSGFNHMPRQDSKLFRKGDLLIGYTTSFRMGQLLQYDLDLTPCSGQRRLENPMEYMVTRFVPRLRKCLKAGGFAKIDDNRETGGEFLVACRGELFTVMSDFQVSHCGLSYDAVGAGYAYALGAFAALESGRMKPKARLIQALEAAAIFCTVVKKPFEVLSVGRPGVNQ